MLQQELIYLICHNVLGRGGGAKGGKKGGGKRDLT
jgi:hypothetical protein